MSIEQCPYIDCKPFGCRLVAGARLLAGTAIGRAVLKGSEEGQNCPDTEEILNAKRPEYPVTPSTKGGTNE